jgi:hypothetical protein
MRIVADIAVINLSREYDDKTKWYVFSKMNKKQMKRKAPIPFDAVIRCIYTYQKEE